MVEGNGHYLPMEEIRARLATIENESLSIADPMARAILLGDERVALCEAFIEEIANYQNLSEYRSCDSGAMVTSTDLPERAREILKAREVSWPK